MEVFKSRMQMLRGRHTVDSKESSVTLKALIFCVHTTMEALAGKESPQRMPSEGSEQKASVFFLTFQMSLRSQNLRA